MMMSDWKAALVAAGLFVAAFALLVVLMWLATWGFGS